MTSITTYFSELPALGEVVHHENGDYVNIYA